MTATASTPVSGPDSVTVLATDQPFDEISERLEAGGYEDRAGVLVRDDGDSLTSYGAIGGEDGVVVLGRSEAATRRALEGDQEGDATRDLLGEVDAPVADVSGSAAGGDCVEAVALGDQVDPAEIEVVTRVQGEADEDRVEAGPPSDAFEVRQTAADGDLGRLTLTYDVPPGVAPTRALVANFSRPYRCPGS